MCEPEASCFDHRNGSYSCVCPLGRSLPEDNCEHKGAYNVLTFLLCRGGDGDMRNNLLVAIKDNFFSVIF